MSEVTGIEVRHALTFLEGARENIVVAERALRRAQSDIGGSWETTKAEAEHREDAVRFVLDAVLATTGWRGVDRKRFQALILAEGRRTPTDGPASVKHSVLLAEARKVLGGKAEG